MRKMKQVPESGLQKKKKHHLYEWHPYGLKMRFGITILLAGLLCSLICYGLYTVAEAVLPEYIADSSFEAMHFRWQGKKLQSFITRNHISTKNVELLEVWENKQPVILMELYTDEGCIYSSFYDYEERDELPDAADDKLADGMLDDEDIDWLEFLSDLDQNPNQRSNVVRVKLADGEATAILYSDFSFQYYLMGIAFSFIISLALFIFIFLFSTRKLISYICKLNDEVQILEGGNLDYQVTVQGNDEITDLARSMNSMKESFREQMESEVELHQANRRLVSEMSHDLRTPLTSILLYLEILRMHRYENEEQMQDYLEKIETKAHHMKVLSDHLFEYSLEGNGEKQARLLSMEQVFEPMIRDFTEELQTNGYKVSVDLNWSPCFVQVKKENLQRIFGNIASNIFKYGEKTAEVFVETIYSEEYCGILVMNTCRIDKAEDMVESSGIGIDSIRTLMKQIGGLCTVEQTDTVFEISLLFPRR